MNSGKYLPPAGYRFISGFISAGLLKLIDKFPIFRKLTAVFN
jgi:hypothetical protein